MQFTIPLLSLRKPLDAVISVVDKGATMPITGNVLLKIHNNQLSVTSTNLQVEMTYRQNLTIDIPDCATTIPGHKLENLCRSFVEDAMLDCEIKESVFTIHSGHFSGSMNTILPDSFPLMEHSVADPQVSVVAEAEHLYKLLDSCAYSMAAQDVRYFLNGMLFEAKQQRITVVATDGHRLAMAHQEEDVRLSKEGSFIIPRRGVLELMRVLGKTAGKAEILVSNNNLLVKIGQLEFQCKLIEGEFPNYRGAIPTSLSNRMIVATKKLIAWIERTTIMSNDKPRGVRLHFDQGKLGLEASNSQGEKAYDELEGEYTGIQASTGFNADYFLAALRKIETEKVEISFREQSESCRIEEHQGRDMVSVIMPMKL